MANRALKSLKFPGLNDTYTIPQVDNTLAVSGAAADAKKTGDAIGDLKSAVVLNGNKSVGILPCLWEQGGLFYGNGREYISATNIRTPFLSVVSGSPIYIAGLDTAHFALYVHEYTDTSTQSGNAKTITTSTYTPATSLVRFRLTKIPDSSQINPTEVPCVLYKLEGYVFDNTVTVYAQYNSREAWIANNPTDKLGDLPVNKIVCIGAPAVSALDMPGSSFYGNVMTVSAKNTLNPGAFQIAVRPSTNDVYIRTYKYSASGNYWTGWTKIAKDEGEVYHVGTGQTYTSLTALLVALRGNQNPKTIYIHEGEYDIFSEYLAEIENGNITIPPDDIASPDYFEPYNVFVPNNTHVVGLGNVVLRFTPTVAQLESMSEESDETGYGASRTWSPLNVYGSVEIENVTVLGKNCRYCLHNDDHNDYPNSKQFYRNCRFLYTYSDADSQSRRLGLNITIGFGIDNGASQIYEGCEFYMDSALSSSAFYGHELSTARNGTIVLKDCVIHSSNFLNTRVIRLQSLASNGRVRTRFENCYINGGIELNMYYTTSTQNFDVTFKNCNKTPLTRSIASGGTIIDPYPVTWYNPLARPTSDNPLVETDAYSSGG